jgi:tRNA G18 (ribose-2'-O)-methylase SpoU
VQLLPIEHLDDPRVAAYRSLRDPELLAGSGLFVVEGRLGVRRLLLESRFRPRSLFLTRSALAGLADAVAALPASAPVYLASRALLCEVVGYNLHRGCLAAAERGLPCGPEAVLEACRAASRPLVVLEDVTNPENVGNVFRNAHAFGAGGVWLTARCADPLYRKATRVSMGATLRLPFARIGGGVAAALAEARAAGFAAVALTPRPPAEPIEAVAVRLAGARLALVFGTESEGLSAAALAAADVRARIPLAPGVDSLNVATASGIALHRLAAAGRGSGAA